MQKTIGNSFVVTTVEDGESAPYYFEEWFAWSNDTSTANVNVSPTIPSGHTWENSIPNSYATYLWRKSIRYVWDDSKRIYIKSREAQYYRMTGTDGTSIHTKGNVDYENSSQGSGTALNLITNPSDGDAYVVCLDLSGNRGWLYQWTTESNTWIPLGQFKGEAGTTYYTHIVWATNVVYEGSTITSIEGYTSAKSPNDTTHVWMGVHVDEIPQDPSSGSDVLLLAYTWSYTKGVKGDDGDDGVSYDIRVVDDSGDTSVEINSVKIGSDTDSTSLLWSLQFKKRSGSTLAAYPCYFAAYKRNSTGDLTLIRQGISQKTSSTTLSASGITRDIDAILIFMSDNNTNLTTNYLYMKEVPVLKDGNTGSRGKVGRAYYFAGVWEDVAADATFPVSDAQAPFFQYTDSGQTRYAVYDSEQNGTYTKSQLLPQTNEKPDTTTAGTSWKVMYDDFKYIITEAIFGNFAKFGSAIINGDWMMSAYGTLYGPGSTNVYEINSDTSSYTIMGVTYTYRNAYTAFDPDYINTYHGGYVTFTPYYCVDLKTGETYQQNAHIRGEVHATSGTFTGEVNATRGTFANVSISENSSFDGDVSIKKLHNNWQMLANSTQTVNLSFGTCLCVGNTTESDGITLRIPSSTNNAGIEIKMVYPVLTRIPTYDIIIQCNTTTDRFVYEGLTYSRFHINQNSFVTLLSIENFWYVFPHRDNDIIPIQD